MQIKKKTQEIVGAFLEYEGFELRTEKAYTSPTNCIYTRKHVEITQTIAVGKSTLGNEIGFSMQTDAWGCPFADPRNIIPELANKIEETKKLSLTQMRPEMIKVISDSNYSMNDRACWPYENEEELKRALWEIREVIEKYGLPWLEKMSIEDEIIPTDEMGKKLFESYEELSKSFATKHHIDTIDKSKENITKNLVVVQKKMKEIERLQYSEAQDELVKIAAFLGEQLRGKFGGLWKLGERERMISICELKTYMMWNYYPLSEIVKAFKESDFDFLAKEYILIVEGELPMTEKQMLKYQEKLKALYSSRNKSQ